MKFDGFAVWGWDAEFREALAAHRPDVSYDGVVADRIRLAIVRQFVEFICEVIDREFRIGAIVTVESVGPNGIANTSKLNWLGSITGFLVCATEPCPTSVKRGRPFSTGCLHVLKSCFHPTACTLAH